MRARAIMLKGRRRLFAAAVACGVSALLMHGMLASRSEVGPRAGGPNGPTGPGRWQLVEPAPADDRFLLQGVVLPTRAVDIPAPAGGRLDRLEVAWGDRVVEGQLLARIRSDELTAQLRDAEAAVLRMLPEALADASPHSASEVRGAERRHKAALRDLELARAREAEVRMLFDKGYVPRGEVDQARRDVDLLATAADEAADEVRRVLDQWNPSQLKARRLARANAEARLQDLRARQGQLVLKAPLDGVVMYPTRSDGRETTAVPELKLGAPVAANDALMTIGDTSSFVVRVTVEEPVLAWLRKDMAATVELQSRRGVPIDAVVARVAALARPVPGNPLAPPEFEVDVRFPAGNARLAAGAAAAVRTGVPARVAVVQPAGPTAFTVPREALRWHAEVAELMVRPGAGAPERRGVKIKRVDAERVLVEEGLKPGDEIWVPAQGAAAREQAGWLKRLFGSDDPEE